MAQTLLLVTGEGLGRGDDELGQRLMIKFFAQLVAQRDVPHTIAFYNAGVRLLAIGSPVVEALRSLDDAGAELVACGTCVNSFGLVDRIAVGRVTDMREIVAAMLEAEKVITV